MGVAPARGGGASPAGPRRRRLVTPQGHSATPRFLQARKLLQPSYSSIINLPNDLLSSASNAATSAAIQVAAAGDAAVSSVMRTANLATGVVSAGSGSSPMANNNGARGCDGGLSAAPMARHPALPGPASHCMRQHEFNAPKPAPSPPNKNTDLRAGAATSTTQTAISNSAGGLTSATRATTVGGLGGAVQTTQSTVSTQPNAVPLGSNVGGCVNCTN